MTDTPLMLISDYVIPELRILEANELRKRGISQTKIAYVLGVSQPAVKKYLESDIIKAEKNLVKVGIDEPSIHEFLDSVIPILLEGEKEKAMLFTTLWSLKNLSLLKLCDFHKTIQRISPSCNICKGIYVENEEKELEVALSLIKYKGVACLIPEVMSNLAYAKHNPKSISDIMAIPGRIIKVKDTIIVPNGPEWGGSKHLATILLSLARKKEGDRSIRAVMNIKYSKDLDDVLDKLNFKYAKVSGGSTDEEIAEIVSESCNNCDVVIHTGGIGIEPITYVFGQDPITTVTKVIKIADLYCGKKSN
ncbi:transcriptional regulator [Sulfolobales archaeon HS-7]|nr:transcriptional regulator [Sulfolobales archaeon HS-7]